MFSSVVSSVIVFLSTCFNLQHIMFAFVIVCNSFVLNFSLHDSVFVTVLVCLISITLIYVCNMVMHGGSVVALTFTARRFVSSSTGTRCMPYVLFFFFFFFFRFQYSFPI